MKRFALVGYPLGHSMSPFIHRQLMDVAGIEGTYDLIPIKKEDLNKEFGGLLSLDGFNVTIPNKVEIIDCLDCLNERATLYGAVNTVRVSDKKGFNTDCFGFVNALKMAKIKAQGKVLICGAGGVARTIAVECAGIGTDVTIAVRESGLNKAGALSDEIKNKLGKIVQTCTIDEILGEFDLLVNCTPVGMFPKINEMIVSENIIKRCSAVFDTIYNPEETMLIKTAKKNNISCSDGMGMLVCQAAVAQEIWNELPPFSEECIEKIVAQTKKYQREKI